MKYTVTFYNNNDQLETNVVATLLEVYEIAELYGVHTVSDEQGQDLTVAVRSVLNDIFPF